MRRLLIIACMLVLAVPAAASAQTTADAVRNELLQAGLPGLQVSVATPAPMTAADYAAFNADSANAAIASATPEVLLSPRPTQPLPVVTVRFGTSVVTPFPGVLIAPGISGFPVVQDSELPIWRLAIMSAVRHRIAAGQSLAGVAMHPDYPSQPDRDRPDVYLAVPSPHYFPAAPRAQTLTAEQVRQDIAASLPPWTAGAEIRVQDFSLRGRILTVDVAVPPLAFNPRLPELVSLVTEKQVDLNERGANIAAAILRIRQSTDGLPLLTSAADPDWGQHFLWAAPVVRPHVMSASGGAPVTPAAVAGEVASQVTGLAPPLP